MDHLRKQFLQLIEDIAMPSSPIKKAALDRIENVRRSQEQVRSWGFVFPEEQIQEVQR